MEQANVERELKLAPEGTELLDRLAAADRLGPFAVVARRRERQRNGYFDTPTGVLRAAGLSVRRRAIAGEALATWTLKGPGRWSAGVTSRPEIEVHLDADVAPLLVVGILRQTARERGAPALAERLADALAGSAPLLAQPYLEIETDRRVVDLEAAAARWQAEMALDRVRLVNHPGHEELEIEVEARRGGDELLSAARAAIEALGPVRDASGSKLSRASAHLAACDCGSARAG